MARIPHFNTKLPTSARGRALLRAGVFAIAVAMERRRIASGSHKRVRRVDARTGAAPGLRQTIIMLGVQDTIRWLLGRAIPRPGTAPSRLEPELELEIERVRVQHANDPGAPQDAIMRIYRERQVRPVNACLPALIRGVAVVVINRCPVPFLAERRTLADVLAGTKLVRSGSSRWTRLRHGAR